MHTNQQTVKKNYLNRIKDILWPVGLTTQDPFILFFSLFSTIFQAVSLHYRVRVCVQINKGFVFRTLDILNT